MAKIKLLQGTKGVYQFWCPGCKEVHQVWTDKDDGVDPWCYNGNVDKPTISPSIKVTMPNRSTMGVNDICHSFIKDGKIEYLSDCTHSMAGKTVAMIDLNDV